MYQVLSSQIASGADATDLLAKALIFSKITMASTAESVNLMTGAMNSYHLQANQAERVTAVLAKTITLGKLRAADLEGTFGRVGPFASQLGVSLEEVGAALATLTRSGVPASEAVTLLESIFTRLVKPSKDMTKFFEEIGVTSGTNAVQVFGFANVLRKLEEATHGSSEELALLFPRLESLRGSIGLTGGLKEFENNLNQITNDSIPNFQKAAEIILESPGAKLKVQANQIKNYMLDEFAQPTIKFIMDIASNIDGGLVTAFKNALTYTGYLSASYAAYKAASLAVSGATALKTKYTAADSIATARNSNIHANAAYAINQEALAKAQDIKATEALMSSETKEAAIATEAAVAHRRNALAAFEASNAQEVTTARAVRLGAVSSSLMATLTSPTVLITGALIAMGAVYEHDIQLAEEQEKAFGEASQKGAENASKLTDVILRETTKQEDAWKKSLNSQYVAYTEFAGSIVKKLNEVVAAQTELTQESVDRSKEALKEYIHAYDEATSHIKSLAKEEADNARNALNDIEKDRNSFHQREFQRNMQLAEHNDRAGVPGKNLPLVDTNQLKLIDDEIKRLQAVISAPAPIGNDPAIAKEHLAEMQKNIAEEEKLYTDLYSRRLKLEDDKKANDAQIAEAEKRAAQHRSIDSLKQELENEKSAQRANSTDKQQHGKGRNDRFIKSAETIKEEEAATRKRIEAERELNEATKDKETLDNLKARSTALEASLAAMPKINEFQKTFTDLQQQSTKALQDFADLREKISKEEALEVENRKKNFEALRVTLQEIAKFKYEKPEVTTEKQKNERIATLDSLVNTALGQGLHSDDVISKLTDTRQQIISESDLKIKQAQNKVNLEILNENKKKLEGLRAAESAKIQASQDKILKEYGSKIQGIIGVGPKQEGALGTFVAHVKGNNDPDSSGRYTTGYEGKLSTAPMRAALENIQNQISTAAKLGQPADLTEAIKRFEKSIEDFNSEIPKLNEAIEAQRASIGDSGLAQKQIYKRKQ